MSLELLENNWDEISKKVINPLWIRFKPMYESVKLDKDDFESLVGEELTKAFKFNYDSTQSSIFTYATNVITRKVKTEYRNMRRTKRIADVVAKSIYQNVNSDSDTTFEDIIENIADSNDDEKLEAEVAKLKVCQLLKPKEKQIFELAFLGFDNKDIATFMKMEIKDVSNIRNRISKRSPVLRVLKMAGYNGGMEDEI